MWRQPATWNSSIGSRKPGKIKIHFVFRGTWGSSRHFWFRQSSEILPRTSKGADKTDPCLVVEEQQLQNTVIGIQVQTTRCSAEVRQGGSAVFSQFDWLWTCCRAPCLKERRKEARDALPWLRSACTWCSGVLCCVVLCSVSVWETLGQEERGHPSWSQHFWTGWIWLRTISHLFLIILDTSWLVPKLWKSSKMIFLSDRVTTTETFSLFGDPPPSPLKVATEIFSLMVRGDHKLKSSLLIRGDTSKRCHHEVWAVPKNRVIRGTGFSHCTKMVSVKSHNDFSRPLVEKGVVWLNRNLLVGWEPISTMMRARTTWLEIAEL